MTKFILSFFALLLTTTFAFAQVDQVRSSAIETFKADFSPQEAGILHVYVDPAIDPAGVYLFRGQEASGTTVAMLPTEYQQLAKRMGAKVYATRAIKLMGTQDHYIVRMAGTYEDRIELFAINGMKVEHVTTLATRKCFSGKCEQTDTWITDIDGDTNSELIQISRTMRGDMVKEGKKKVYTFTEKGKWKKSKRLAMDAPWSTVEFYGKQ